MTKFESIAVRLRRIAEDLSQARHAVDLEYPARLLLEIADELERVSPSTSSGVQGHGTD